MTKRTMLLMLLLCLAAIGVAIGASAEEVYRGPAWYQVAPDPHHPNLPGETLKSIARVNMITVEDLIKLNAAKFKYRAERDPKHPFRLIPGEKLNVNRNCNVEFTWMIPWNIRGGAPRGPSLVSAFLNGEDSLVVAEGTESARTCVDKLPLSWDSRVRIKSLLEASRPVIDSVYSTPDDPLILDCLAFDSLHPQFWLDVICDWTDGTKAYVLKWPGRIDLPQEKKLTSFQPMLFLGCQNLGSPRLIEALPEEEAPLATPATPESTVITLPEAEAPPETVLTAPHQLYKEVVLWGGPEGKWLKHTVPQYNFYGGLEAAVFNNEYKTIGSRLRVENGFFGFGRGRTMSENYSLGFCFGLPSTESFRMDHDFGLGYRAEQVFSRKTFIDRDWNWRTTEEKLWNDGPWWYYRLQTITPFSYTDGRYRDGRTVRELGGFLNLTPGDRFYAKIGGDRQIRKDWTRHLHGETQSGPADTTDMFEARVGLRSVQQDKLVYAIYQTRRFYSPDYWQKVWGVGLGGQWYPRTPNWRLEADVTYNEYDTLVHWWINDVLTPQKFWTNGVEAKLMIVVTPARLFKPFQLEPLTQP